MNAGFPPDGHAGSDGRGSGDQVLAVHHHARWEGGCSSWLDGGIGEVIVYNQAHGRDEVRLGMAYLHFAFDVWRRI